MAIPFSYTAKNLMARKLTAVLTAGGMALVVFVFATVLMLQEGLRKTLVETGLWDNVVVTRRSAGTEVQSGVDRAQAGVVESQPEVAYGGDGLPLVSKETVVLVTLPKRDSDKPSNVIVRGVGPKGQLLRPQIRIIEGRMFRPGSAEIVAGRSIAERFQGAGAGEQLRFAMREWRVVGVFDAGRSGFDSEIWGDSDQLMQAFRRPIFSSVIVRLQDAGHFDALKSRLEADPRLTVEAKRETVFYAEQSRMLANFIGYLGLTLSVIFSIGATIGAMITMYASVANRTAEIGTLRALGFRSRNVLAVFLLEALLLGFVGGAVGLVLASFLDVLDALYDERAVEYINVRHEQAAAFMADGLARVTDLPGVCLVTSGPGATNLLTGVAAAYVAHSPVVVLVGSPALDHLQKDAFQEYDLVSMFRPVTKYAVQVTKAARIPELLQAALRAAMTGRRGPVLVDIPRDVLNDQTIKAPILGAERYRPIHPQPPHPDAIREAARMLAQAERPLLLVGGGVTRAGATDLLVQLAEQLAIPMITAYGRNDAVPNTHPLYIGPLGRAGAPEAAAACRRADVLLVLGSRLGQFTSHFDDRSIKPDTAIIQIDIESRDIGRYYPVALGIQADARESCAALLGVWGSSVVGPPSSKVHTVRHEWAQEIAKLREQRQVRLAADARHDTMPMKPQRVYAELRKVLSPDTIVALDAGAAPAYGYDRLQFGRPRTFLTPLDLGGLGFAFPVALGAKLGRPEAPVVAIHGDGGFLMNAQEIETAVRHRINTVTVVMNNNCWGSEKAYQKAFYNERYIGCDIGNPRYDEYARLFGAAGFYAEHPDQVGDVMKAALGAGKPAIVEIPIDPNEFPAPATQARAKR